MDRDIFDKAQDIRRERAEAKADTPRVPLNMRGISKEEMIASRYDKELSLRKSNLITA